MASINVLESKQLLSILLFVNEHGPCWRVDIYENVSWNTNIPKNIALLEEIRLLFMDEDDRNSISFTESGRLVGFQLVISN
ncbi:hypothetical protein [Candidatus Methanarcanum hacksteinii]|uniref:hypothetical protein n=1 Tax=Candidatus Methanarcanum hacksteinii TaxID=2911857 RepID=UPI0037DDB0C6